MLHGHSVGVARETERNQGHVQQTFVETTKLFQTRRAVAAENATRLFHRKSIVAGWNWRVRGEHAFAAHLCDVRLRCRPQRTTAELALQQRQRQQRSMAFVHVIHVYSQPQRIGHARPTHAQHNLLLQAIIRVSAI